MNELIYGDFKIRFAQVGDAPVILKFIKELAEYEDLLHEVVATEESLKKSLFDEKLTQAIIGEYKGEPVGLALYFYNYSTFLGKRGLYLEDLYIRPKMREKGFGKVMLSFLASVAKQNNCGRLEWACLDENKPSIEFYKSLGSKTMDEWTVYRLSDEKLDELAQVILK